MFESINNLFEITKAVSVEQVAIDSLRAMRWKDGAYCPHCGSTLIYHFSDNKNHKCGECHKRFSIKVGTIFEDSKVPLRKWFIAIWLVVSYENGISSTTLAKEIEVTQKTAWRMLSLLRHASTTKSFNAPLTDC